MKYRKYWRGNEFISEIGLGLGNIHVSSNQTIEETIQYAVENGINYFDLCGGRIGVYEIFGNVVSQQNRKAIYTQMHFGAVYPNGRYAFSRNLEEIKLSFETVLNLSQLKYTDFGFIHCIDEEDDFNDVMNNGLFDYVCNLKEKGIVKHIGFSTHTPSIASKFIETGKIDLFMFSINPAFDFNKGQYAYGSIDERQSLYQKAQSLGIGISVMKPFAGGQLLDEKRSPLKIKLSMYQCLQYALDKPGVITCLPGVSCVDDVKNILKFFDLSSEQKDYSIIHHLKNTSHLERCVYCNHCSPCPAGIDIGLVNKYYDLAINNDERASVHYLQLSKHAGDCLKCNHCNQRCPFHVKQQEKMEKIYQYFGI